MKLRFSTYMTFAAMAAWACFAPESVHAQAGGGAGAGQQSAPQGVPSRPSDDVQRQQQEQMERQRTDTQTDTGSQKMAKSPDVAFALKASQGGMAEVKLGQLAAQKATSPDVKAFGQLMVDDHSKANEELKSVAAKQGINLPNTLDDKDSALYTKLENASADKFDQEYVKAMVKDHQQDVKEFQNEADKGKNPEIKEFASRTTPVLQSHLDKIKSIQTSIGGKASKGRS
jgi:putative membrane protein